MEKVHSLKLGYTDAENYKRRENKEILNKIFVDDHIEKLISPQTSFLIGEKGTGKTAYSIYLSNNNFKNTFSDTKYVRETEYDKFIYLKKQKQLDLSDFKSIWKVILLLLISKKIIDNIGITEKLSNYTNIKNMKTAIDEYYHSAFSPEIIQAMSFVENSNISAGLIFKHFKTDASSGETVTFSESRFQTNLFYIQKKFEESLNGIKLKENYILFIDGIDIRPGNIEFYDYLDCVKGLANAAWELNNDFFSQIKDSKGRMKVVLLLRPDIFNSIGMQNQNTKIRENSLFLDWKTEYKNHRTSDIFKIVSKVLDLNKEKNEDGNIISWDYYFPWNSPNIIDSYSTNTSFLLFLRWSYYRPRDILTMLSILKENFEDDKSKSYFSLDDLESSDFKRKYSEYLLGEIKDQISFYYSSRDYDIFLKFFEFLNGKDNFTYSQYGIAYEKFVNYIKTISEEKPQFTSSKNDFLQFLFDLNIICYIERPKDDRPFIHWCFRDRSYANVSPKVKTGVEYQIFYGLQKSLNVGKEFIKIVGN